MKTNLESLDKKAVSQLTNLQIWTLNISPGLSECPVKDKDKKYYRKARTLSTSYG